MVYRPTRLRRLGNLPDTRLSARQILFLGAAGRVKDLPPSVAALFLSIPLLQAQQTRHTNRPATKARLSDLALSSLGCGTPVPSTGHRPRP